MNNVYRIYRDAQARRNNLRKRGFMPLTVAVRAGKHGHAAGGVHAHLAAFKQAGARAQCACNVAGCQATGFDVAGVANAAQQALGFGCRLACWQAGNIGQLVGACQQCRKVANVILQRHRRLIRESGNEVTAADFVLAQAKLPTRTSDNTLQQIRRFWPARTAVSINRSGIGKPGIDLAIHQWRGVLPSQ